MSYMDAALWIFDVHGAIMYGIRLNSPKLAESERCVFRRLLAFRKWTNFEGKPRPGNFE